MGIHIILFKSYGHIYFCNILLIDHTDHIQNLFQSVQNACAKAITGAHRFYSAREQLATLHWLPIKQQCRYKALLFCHPLAHSDKNFPSYFSNVHLRQSKRCTRLSGPLLDSNYKPRLSQLWFVRSSFMEFTPRRYSCHS